MSIQLKSGELTLKLESAGEKYRGSRFDWNGFAVSAKFRGVELLGEEKPRFQRNPAIFGRGLNNEFGIKKCVGYDDCAVGEWFPKIGTGWLRKDDKPYFFYNQYVLDPLSFSSDVSADRTRATFACESGERNGYAYRYVKKYSLEGASFRISYELENLGSKPIDTDEYVHNFLCVGGKRMDSGYSLSFPWKLNPLRFIETNNPDKILSVEENRVLVTGKTENQFYLGGLTEGVGAKDGLAAQWTLTHAGKKISLTEKGSFAPAAVHLWGWKSVISPEVFFAFRLEPGKSVAWERTYEAGRIQG
jgi:hypothetical protein